MFHTYQLQGPKDREKITVTQKIKNTPPMLYPIFFPPGFRELSAASQISAIEMAMVPKIIGLRLPTRSRRKTMKMRFVRGPMQL